MDNRFHKIEGTFEKSEEWLQRYLATHPELLPTRDLEGIGSKLSLIGRELAGIDLLFIDERGLLTVVETKLVDNPEARREVVAQLLDYAAQLGKLDVVELCRLTGEMEGNKAIQGLGQLEQLSRALKKCLHADSLRKELEETAKAIFATYALECKVDESAKLSERGRLFLERVDQMLADGSFRLIVVTYEVSKGLLDLLNYTNATMRRGHQLIAIEFSIQDFEDAKYFVPHLVGAPGLLSAVYYREERAGKRLYQEWTKERFLKELSPDLTAEISHLIAAVEDRKDRLWFGFGKGGKTGSLLLGAKLLQGQRQNTLLAIWTSGKVTLYFSLAQTKLSEGQKKNLLQAIGSRPFLEEAYKKIATGMKQGKRYGAEPRFILKDCGKQGERWKKLLQLLEDFHRIANT